MNDMEEFPAGNSSICQLDMPATHLDVKMASVEDVCDNPPCNSYQGVPKVGREEDGHL